MSTPSFKAVLFIGDTSVRAFRATKSGWETVEGEFTLENAAEQLQEVVQGENVLAVVSDLFCGHVQIALPNKKEQLSEEHLGQVLQEEYQIDLSAYEFASQRFAVGRQFVQVSVSGVEKELYQKITDLCWSMDPKKVWVMPFGWFVSVLKSVEPALLAVIEDAQHVHVSHHYLGVDDARQIELDQLAAYAQSRKEERKETHLLYAQSPKKLMSKVDKALNAIVAVHPLIPDAEGEPLVSVVNAVMQKGAETLHELLHFEPSQGSVVEAVKPMSVPEQAAVLEKALAEQDAPKSADELPKPVLPAAAVAASTLRAPHVPTVKDADLVGDEVVGDEVVGETEDQVEESVVETKSNVSPVVPEEEPVVSKESVQPVEELPEVEPEPTPVKRSIPSEPVRVIDEEDEAIATEPAVEGEDFGEPAQEESLGFLAQLQANKVGENNTLRYVEVKQKSQWKTAFLVFVVVFVVTALVGGGIFWSQQAKPPVQALLPASPTPTPSPVTEPSPEPVVEATPSGTLAAADKAKLKVIIYNATGINGLAGKVKSKLEAAGWKGVKTGNATGGSYSDAVFVSSKTAGAVDQIGADLGSAVKSTDAIKESGAEGYDVVIVLAENPLE